MSFFSQKEIQQIIQHAGMTSWDLKTPSALNIAVMLFQQKLSIAVAKNLHQEQGTPEIDSQRVYQLIDVLFNQQVTEQ